MITEAVGREIAMDVLLVCGSRGIKFLHGIATDDLFLNRQTLLRAVFQRPRGPAG